MKKNKLILLVCIIAAAALGAVYLVKYRGNHQPSSQLGVYNSQVKDTIETDKVLLNVPFTTQAPLGHWEDPRQEDGCEEASVLMAWLWLKSEGITPQDAENEIIAMSQFEEQNYGNYHDTNTEDTVKFMSAYYDYKDLVIGVNPSIDDIKKELTVGNLVLVPANGQRLDNPHFKQPGPTTHMLVIKGFDNSTGEFITNDPGTRFGESYKYKYQVVFDAMVDYPTGNHESQEGRPKSMIVVQK